ncbi:leucine rich repeat [Podochytrium sp. JEL0797]|nr:leucine rich repeat [Podochytrium sp. JEL0797]
MPSDNAPSHSQTTLSLHARNITFMDPVVLMSMPLLTHLDLSSNDIERIEALAFAPNILELNLSCNKIHKIEGLKALRNLHRLILSFNCIQTLEGLTEVASSRFYYLDLKGNRIEDFGQLYYLAGTKSLKNLVLKGEDGSTVANPICKNVLYSQRTREILPFLESLDDPFIKRFPELEDEILNLSSSNTTNASAYPSSQHTPAAYPPIDDRILDRLGIIQDNLATLSRGNTQPQRGPSPSSSSRAGPTENNMMYYFQAVMDRLDKTNRSNEAAQEERDERLRIRELEGKVNLLTDALERSRVDALRGMVGEALENADEVSSTFSEDHEMSKCFFVFLLPVAGLTQFLAKSPPREAQSNPTASVHHETQSLLDALEAEKQNWIQTEQRYSSEIVSMNERVVSAERVAAEEKARCVTLEEKVKNLLESEKLKSENNVLVQSDLERRLNEALAKSSLCEQEAARLKQDLMAATMDVEQLRCLREIEVYRIAVRKLQKHKTELAQAVSQTETQHAAQIEDLKKAHVQEMADAVAKATLELTDRHGEEVEKLARMLQTTKSRNDELEQEFRKSISGEQKKYTELFKAFQELAEESNGIAKSLKETKKSETDLRTVTRELTNVIKDQKLHIAELSHKNEASFSIFEEKCMLMEGQVKSLNDTKSDLEAIKNELDGYKSDVARKQDRIAVLDDEKAAISKSLSDQVAAFQKERDLLLGKIHSLEEEVQSKKSSTSEVEQALRIKNKMLDDQNDTIRTLKQNLENKTREHGALLQEIASNEGKLDETISKEKKRSRELSLELAMQEEAFEQLQNAFQECKDERDALHSELMEVSKKLQERNMSIARIEEEVGRVKNAFSAKEQKLRTERDDLIKSRDVAVDEVKRFYEVRRLPLSVFVLSETGIFFVDSLRQVD